MNFSKLFGAFIMLFAGCFLFATSSFGVTTAERTLSIGSGSASPGGTVDLPITIDDHTGVAGAAFTLAYNPGVLKFLGFNILNQTLDNDDCASNTHDYSSIFYQTNDIKSSDKAIVMVAAATAQGFTSNDLFNAQFEVIAGTNASGTQHIALIKSIIKNPNAGYDIPTSLPVLVGLPATDPVNGFYPTHTFTTDLQGGSINITGQSYTISGTVEYTGSQSATGSTVLLQKSIGSGSYLADSRTTVAIDGSYTFTKPAGDYRILIRPYNNSYYPAETTLTLPATTQGTTYNFTLQQAVAYNSTVKINNLTLPGVSVQVTDPAGQIIGRYTLNINGFFETAPLPPLASDDSYTFTAFYGSMDLGTIDITQSSNNLTATLQKLAGTVTPPTGANVSLQVSSFSARMNKSVLVTGATTSGTQYTIENLPPANDYIVSAFTEGAPLLYFDAVTDISQAQPINLQGANATSIDFNFSSLNQATISGRILDGSSGAGGMPVYAMETTSPTNAISSIMSDSSDGNFTMTVPPGSYRLFVLKGSKVFFYNSNATTNKASEATLIVLADQGEVTGKNIDISEQGTCSISGYVKYQTEDGLGVHNAIIFTDNQTYGRAATVSSRDGSFKIAGLQQGEYQIGMNPMLKNYGLQFQDVSLTTTNCDATINPFVINNNTYGIDGKIIDKNSNGIPKALIYMVNNDTGKLAGGRMFFGDNDGNYTIGDIPSAPYTLFANHPEYKENSEIIPVFSDLHNQDITLLKGTYINGTVTDVDTSKSVDNVNIVAITTGAAPIYGRTNKDGQYDIFGINSSNSYTVIASKRGYQSAFKSNITLTADSVNAVNLSLSKEISTFTLSGNVADGCTTTPMENARIIASYSPGSDIPDFIRSVKTDTSGDYSIANLPQAKGYTVTMLPVGDLAVQRESVDGNGTNTVMQDFTIPCSTDNSDEISGTITRGDNTASAYVVLFVVTPTSDEVMDYRIVASGQEAYAFNGLRNDKNYKIMAVAQGYNPSWHDSKTSKDTATAITAGNTAVNFTLTATN